MDITAFLKQGGLHLMLMQEAHNNHVGPPLEQIQKQVKTAHYLKEASEVYFVK